LFGAGIRHSAEGAGHPQRRRLAPPLAPAPGVAVRRAGRAEPAGRVVLAGPAGRGVPGADAPGWLLAVAMPWRVASAARYGAVWLPRTAARGTAN